MRRGDYRIRTFLNQWSVRTMLPKFFTQLRLWLFALAVTIGLTGCWAINDIIAPSVAEVGESVYMTRQLKPEFANSEDQLTHHWDFGDGSTAEGNAVEHTYTQAGEYTVVLTATDTEGQKFDSQHVIKVIPVASGPLNVAVLTADSQLISGATVRINGQGDRYTTDDFPAAFSNVPTSRKVMISVEAPGFVSTAVLLDPLVAPSSTVRQAVVHLMPMAAPLQVEDISQAQTLRVETLQASVAVPEGAFVDASTGQPALGAANVSITPWDVTNARHMTSFPGDRRAFDAARQRLVRLISFGMMDVKVTSSTGEPLQLAAGKTAQIQMDLPISTDENGTALVAGDTIPLWHFNEAEGLWRQEGQGTVIASTTSASGLAVSATVSHFSSWNWDRVEGGQSVAITRNIRCVAPDAPNTLVKPCAINVQQTLPNGSVLSNQLEAPEGAIDFASFVPTAAVQITAVSVDSLRRGRAVFPLAADAGAVMDVVMSEQLTMQNPLAGIPFIRLPEVQVSFVLPPEVIAEVQAAGASNYISVNQIKYTKGDEVRIVDVSEYVAVAGPYANTWVDSNGLTYVTFNRLVSGNTGVPGALADGNLNGNLTIEANAEYYSKAADGSIEVKTVPLVAQVSIPVISRSGPAISQQGLETYILWSDFSSATYAASEGDTVTYQLSEVTPDGVILNTSDPIEGMVYENHSLSIGLPSACSGGDTLYSFDITVTSAKDGTVANYKTRPMNVTGWCPT